jgi:hypothetical protein
MATTSGTAGITSHQQKLCKYKHGRDRNTRETRENVPRSTQLQQIADNAFAMVSHGSNNSRHNINHQELQEIKHGGSNRTQEHDTKRLGSTQHMSANKQTSAIASATGFQHLQRTMP